jgi:hypothetical protein
MVMPIRQQLDALDIGSQTTTLKGDHHFDKEAPAHST